MASPENESEYHVVPDADGRWKIRLPETSVGSQSYASRDEALDRAAEMARAAPGAARVIVHDAMGGVERTIDVGEIRKAS
ncbi:MAG: DUF2188 domain-containing protein [Minicystis sp.]